VQTTVACDACGSTTCPDKHLCDVSWDNYQPVPASNALEAEREIDSTWGSAELRLDPELISKICTVLSEGHPAAIHAPAAALLAQGHSFRRVAMTAGIPLSMLTRRFLHGVSVDTALKAEAMLRRAVPATTREVCDATGLDLEQVNRLARTLGVQAAPSRTAKGGGSGRVYTDEQIAEGWRLRDAGMSYGRIAKAMNLKDANAASGMLKRNARPETVAA
jgi:hypothetical protein